MKSFMEYLMQWLLDERIILLVGAIIFAFFTIYLIHLDSKETYVTGMSGLTGMLIGALVRGITGANGTKPQ